MIPVRDVIPSRTSPAVTLTLVGTLAAACVSPQVRQWWLPWLAHAIVLWLAGSTVEDRFGHLRFAAFVAVCAAAAAAAPAAVGRGTTPLWVLCGVVAAVAVAYAVMFPRSRALVLIPVAVGVELTDVPAWTVFALWAAVQAAAAWSALSWPSPVDAAGAAISATAGAVAGAMGGLLLPRPERMRVDWWDRPAR